METNLDTNNSEDDASVINSQIVKTDIGANNGQNKCPKCGSTDISTDINTGRLRCNYCRFEFEAQKIEGMVNDINQLNGQVIGSGASDIIADTNDVVTFKCSSCGAEVVVDTSASTQARCHWCRNTLSVNQQIPNGSVPDAVLPFKVSKEEAKAQIEKFVGNRKYFAHPKFKSEFTTANIMGVYFPYMVVDVNSHSRFIGQGEHQTGFYFRGTGSNTRQYFDADLYQVERDFDLTIDGLTVESSADKLSNSSINNTNNIINAIMPFDIDNCVKYDSNYIKGYSSEKRDVNIEQLKPIVETQSKDIARHSCNETIKQYDRGVSWTTEQLYIKGQQWKAAYLPVWLYSYQQINGNTKILHYVAVNGRTTKTMGSVPIYYPKLIGISALIELIGIFAMLFINFDGNWLFALTGIAFFLFIYLKYRNSNARHYYEKDTKTQISNLKNIDALIKHETGLTNGKISGANNNVVNGQNIENKILDSIIDQTPFNDIVNNFNMKGNDKK
jgi:DNA-directed RNA polymerase subunit RPC12/RpoP